MQEAVKMNRRDLAKFVDVKEMLDAGEEEDSFGFITNDVTEELKYK